MHPTQLQAACRLLQRPSDSDFCAGHSVPTRASCGTTSSRTLRPLLRMISSWSTSAPGTRGTRSRSPMCPTPSGRSPWQVCLSVFISLSARPRHRPQQYYQVKHIAPLTPRERSPWLLSSLLGNSTALPMAPNFMFPRHSRTITWQVMPTSLMSGACSAPAVEGRPSPGWKSIRDQAPASASEQPFV